MGSQEKVVSRNERPAIQPRLFEIELGASVPRYWVSDDPYCTHLLNALSCTFPGGERFFLRSVLRFQSAIKDPILKREVRQFCGQEAVHGQQHDVLNQWAERCGYPLVAMAERFERHLTRRSALYSDRLNLALTAALEHFTAVMGNALLKSPGLLDHFHPEVRPLWVWHAIEEIEHKSVAFDVLTEVGGTYQLRIAGMGLAIVGLTSNSLWMMSKLLWQDRRLFDVRSLAKLLKIVHSTGFLSEVMRGLGDYFKRDFHPWQIDDRELLREYLPKIEFYVQKPRSGLREVPV